MRWSQPIIRIPKNFLLLQLATAITAAIAGLVLLRVSNPFLVSLGLVALVALVLTVVKLEWGVLMLAFITYIRLSDVIIDFHGGPSIAKALVALLIAAILIRRILFGMEIAPAVRQALPLALFGLTYLLSFPAAKDVQAATMASIDFAQDAIIAIIFVLVVRRLHTFKQLIYALLAAGIFMSAFGIYQQLTNTFANDYWGFGRADIRHITGSVNSYRISGPIGDSNVFAQILVALIPLALERFWHERKWYLKLFATVALAACTLTVFLTFSRGGFVALVLVAAIMIVHLRPKPLHIATTIVVAIILIQFLPNKYTERMKTLTHVIPGVGSSMSEGINTESSFRGRASEMMAALLVFVDHPVIGVGPNNFPLYYQKYSQRAGIDPTLENRVAHSLYLQVAAEMGIVGVAAFGFLVWRILRGLKYARLRLISSGMPEHATMVRGFTVAFIGYLAGAMFIDASYSRFFYLLAGIALAAPLLRLDAEKDTQDSVETADKLPAKPQSVF